MVHTTPSQAYGTLSYHINAPFRTRPRLSFEPQRGENDKPSIEERELYPNSPNCLVRDRFTTPHQACVSELVAKQECPKRSIDIPSFGAQFEPRYIFRAGRLDQ